MLRTTWLRLKVSRDRSQPLLGGPLTKAAAPINQGRLETGNKLNFPLLSTTLKVNSLEEIKMNFMMRRSFLKGMKENGVYHSGCVQFSSKLSEWVMVIKVEFMQKLEQKMMLQLWPCTYLFFFLFLSYIPIINSSLSPNLLLLYKNFKSLYYPSI